MLSTSGSSGPPKIIVHSQRSVAAAVDLTAQALAVQDGEWFFCPAQPTHVTGIIFGLFMPLLYRSSCLFITRWDPARAAELVDRYRCTVSSAVPTFLIDLHDEWRKRGGGGFLQRYCTGATDVPTDRITEIERETGCVLVRGYGSTEAPMITCGDVHDEAEARLTLDGSLMAPGEVIVDAPDESGVGELLLRGPQMALGYWQDGRLTPIADENGWYHTSDLGRVTDGYVKVSGRLKDVIIRGGVKFYAPELDGLVAQMPGVLEAASFGVADERLGQLPGVAVVMAPGTDPPSVEAVGEHFAALSVAPQKCPVAVMAIGALPLTESRKLNRPELARTYAESMNAG
jgi:cyclohexanecarboxylate-CoA ligase